MRSQPWGSGAVRVLDYPTEPLPTEELRTLIAAVEALLPRIGGAADSEFGQLHRSTEQALAAAKAALAAPATEGHARRMHEGDPPWAALGLTALFALAIGVCAGRAAAEWR
jgi:ElaB/YqjD/DUF883 family membrane-anchored ribosome-binding protein